MADETSEYIAFIDRRMYSLGEESRRRTASVRLMPFGTYPSSASCADV